MPSLDILEKPLLEGAGRRLMRDENLEGNPWRTRCLVFVEFERSVPSRSEIVLGMRFATLPRWTCPGVEGVVGFEK